MKYFKHNHTVVMTVITLFFITIGMGLHVNRIDTANIVSLNRTELKLTASDSEKLYLKNIPKDANIIWKTSNKKVAVVNKKGKVKAVKEGTAKITAIVKAKKTTKLSCNVIVKNENQTTRTIKIQIGDKNFNAILYDNDSVKEWITQMPMTIDMSELNGNEKYYYMPADLPADSQSIKNIYTGDLMLYGSDCLVLFYKDFQTSYKYTKLGYLQDTSGLEEALGRENIKVTFSLDK